MGFLTALLERRATVENPHVPLTSATLLDWFSGGPTAAGVTISEGNALAVGALFAVVRVISETLATVPLILHRRRGDRGRERARNHPLFSLLHDTPNDRMTSFTWREVSAGHIETWGNSYSEIIRTNTGQVTAINPLRPDRVEIEERASGLWYLLDEGDGTGRRRAIPARSMLHVPGLGFDGVRGYSPVRLHAEALGYAKGLEQFGAGWFGRGSTPSGILTFPGRLKPEAKNAIKESWNRAHQGVGSSSGVAVLEDGLTWTQVGVPPEDAQFIQSKVRSVEEVARIWRMQLHKIQLLDRATFSNIEQQAIEHVVDTILPRVTRFEQEANRKLLSTADRQSHSIEFLLDGLHRGDLESRYKAYAVGRQWGWLSANDVLEMENKNPLPDGQGEHYMVPMNMVDAATLGDDGPLPPVDVVARAARLQLEARARERRGVVLRQRIQDSMARLLEGAARAFTRREVDQVRRAIRRHLGQRQLEAFEEWLATFYSLEGFQRTVSTALDPVLLTFAEQLGAAAAEEVAGEVPELGEFVRGYSATTAGRHAESHRDQLLALVRDTSADDLVGVLEGRTDEWLDRAAGKFSAREKVEAGSAIAKAVWAAAGVAGLFWVTVGDNCPLCNELDGRRVGISEAFVSPGDVVDPGGGTAPLRVNSTTGHPPLHEGCNCSIIPG